MRPPTENSATSIVATVPTGVGEDVLSASEHIPADRLAVWLGEN